MHPLIPDSVVFRSLADNHVIHEYDLSELTLTHIRPRLRGPEIKLPMADIFYSFGRSHPGAISLHNFPRYLQEFKRGDTEAPIDLATVDILRIREQGVPRYNEFRRLLRLKPASSFEELTDNPAWAEELRQVYGDVERVDLMIGLYAEPKPPGFGFSDTAFRIFILMATRRLQSDRFFTRDFRAEVYTQAGMDWVNTNTMRTVLLRHFPSLEPALDGVQNPFAPWAQVSGNQTPIPYSKDLERISPDEDKLIGRIVKVLHWNNNYEFRKNKHAIRDAHAKSHGILRGELTVHDDLPKELRQGLFANPGKTYSVIARLSSTSGAIRSDQLRGVRGLGIKVLGVEGNAPGMVADLVAGLATGARQQCGKRSAAGRAAASGSSCLVHPSQQPHSGRNLLLVGPAALRRSCGENLLCPTVGIGESAGRRAGTARRRL
jgi:hypothetical protein